MTMPPRTRRLLSSVSVTALLLAALPIYRELTRRSDIWWTPLAMLVPFTDGTDRVEVYVRGEPLTALLHVGRVYVREDGRASVVAPGEVGLRFNNSDRVRAGRLPFLLVCAGVCGAVALALVLVLTGRLAYRAEETRA